MTTEQVSRIRVRDGAIYAYCRAQDITRAKLARQMGVTEQTAYRVEQGHVDPSPKFIASLMGVTGSKFEDLFEIVTDAA